MELRPPLSNIGLWAPFIIVGEVAIMEAGCYSRGGRETIVPTPHTDQLLTDCAVGRDEIWLRLRLVAQIG